MKRLLLFGLLPVLGFAQGVNVPGTALKAVNGVTSPFGGATVTVCAAAAVGTPCTPVLPGTLFQNEALTIPLGNSFTADLNGNFNFFIAPGTYTVTITGAGFAGYSYQLTAQCPLKASCTWAGAQIFTNPTITGLDSGIETLQNKTLTSPIISGTVTNYNGVATVSNGVPALVAKVDATAQSANISASTLYAVPAGGAGFYRLTGYTVVTRAATTSSTLPSITVSWTDNDSAVANSNFAFTNTLSTNTVGTTNSAITNVGTGPGDIILNVQAGTNISYGTTSYASSGATSMQYAVHVKLEYLGQ